MLPSARDQNSGDRDQGRVFRAVASQIALKKPLTKRCAKHERVKHIPNPKPVETQELARQMISAEGNEYGTCQARMHAMTSTSDG